MVIYYLTCANKDEATIISHSLLEKRLIACARQTPVSSSYWWNDEINHDDEILLMMESVEEKFDEIEKVVATLHSYETHVLTAVPVLRTTPKVHSWINETLGKRN